MKLTDLAEEYERNPPAAPQATAAEVPPLPELSPKAQEAIQLQYTRLLEKFLPLLAKVLGQDILTISWRVKEWSRTLDSAGRWDAKWVDIETDDFPASLRVRTNGVVSWNGVVDERLGLFCDIRGMQDLVSYLRAHESWIERGRP